MTPDRKRSHSSPETPFNLPRLLRARVAPAIALAFVVACSGKKKNEDPMDIPAPPNVATQKDIGTEIGNGRSLDTGAVDVPTTTKFTRLVALDKDKGVVAGEIAGDAVALTTNDGGRSFTAYATKTSGMVTWSVGADGTVVLTSAVRQIPKKPLPKDQSPPIDTITFFFGPPGGKLSAPAPLLAPDEKQTTPTIPWGEGMPAVLGPSLASVVVELKPRVFAVAFGGAPGEALPTPIQLPNGEIPIHAPYGRPPQLLTFQNQKILVRPWPKPGEALAVPKPIDRVGTTKTLISELSTGPECEYFGWSYKRVAQGKDKVFLLGISPDKTVFFELPGSTLAQSPLACSADRVVVEALNPKDNLPSLVTCQLDGSCVPPENRPFLKPWPEQHDRKLGVAVVPKGIVAVQYQKTKVKWAMAASESNDGGKLYNLERRIGGADGYAEEGYDLGALIGMGDRALLFMTAKVTKTTRRSWYVLATDNAGLTWGPP